MTPKKFGLTMHTGTNGAKSNTEAMYIPSASKSYDDENTADFVVHTTGSVHFTQAFKYLGGMIESSMKSDLEIDSRIKAATKAFGALSGIFNNKDLPKRIKGELYSILIITIYGMLDKIQFANYGPATVDSSGPSCAPHH